MQNIRLLAMTLVMTSFFAFEGAKALADGTNAAELFPAATQGFIRITNLPRMMDRWQATQLGNLSQVEGMAEFWEGQKQEIESRLADAGWQLNLQPEDIYQISSGEAAIGWIDRSANAKKPFSLALAVDVQGNEEATRKLLERIEQELKAKQGSTEKSKLQEYELTRFVLPRKPGELVIHESYFVLRQGRLLAADDAETIKLLVEGSEKSLPNRMIDSELYKSAMGRLTLRAGDYDLDYFVRPIGLAKVVRSISKKTPARNTDMLKALENQGFDKLAAVCGRLRFSAKEYDVYHEGFVVAPQPLPKSVQILDFPNGAKSDIPSWVSSSMSGLAALSWNVRDAFWKVEGLVDELAGGADTFKYVIEGIETDPLGPQIDIKNQVMPCLTNEIYAASDCIEPITPDSKRSLIAIRVTDVPRLQRVLEKAMKSEPDAKAIDFEGQTIWKVSRQDDANLGLAVDEGTSKKKKKQAAAEEDEPWLSNWAITVYDGFLMFSSHSDMIQEAIRRQKAAKSTELLSEEKDFARVQKAIAKLTEGQPMSIWRVNRVDRSFEMQYELFRQGKLPQSRSMMASLLDRLLHPKTEVRDQVQKVNGNRLPKFDLIRKYLMPTGLVVRSEKGGWFIQSFVLSGEDASTESTANVSARTADRAITGTSK